ncbi:MAG: DNA mismatch repair endonuclease MutL [Prevotella sp.]|nr:DNA mismatch repair endonuclease MutL [Prevotella sp.]
MSDIIQLLPDSVANQIAAGEVIQRPASVIKELVENAIDAGATQVSVLVVDAGRTSIQVIDNGKGMSETDARLAFERHATSKITSAADLFSLHTMGFRGEALASVAAVAQVELKTRQANSDIGTHLSIAASKVTGQEPCSCAVGSNFNVENLFYNVPARRKFLKANSTELKNIVTAFERIALVYPDVTFHLYSNETELYNLKAAGLRQRIVDVLGKRINPMLIPINTKMSICNITGFIGKPESAKKKSLGQFFFVNGRYMKHPYFHKVVMNAYDRLVPEGEQVPYFIYLEVPAENIDVNIHPTKTEIKFENEQDIANVLMATVKESIGMFSQVATLDFDNQGRPDIPVFDPNDNVQAPKVEFNPDYNPFNDTPSTTPSAPIDSMPIEAAIGEGLFDSSMMSASTPRTSNSSANNLMVEGLRTSNPATAPLFPDEETAPESDIFVSKANMGANTAKVSSMALSSDIAQEENTTAHYQYKGKYIMTAVKSGLMIIDQHRAHTRILYEQYLDRVKRQQTQSQKLLFPEMLHLTPSEHISLEKVMPELTALGFELTHMGGDAYAINAMPSGLNGLKADTLLHDMIASTEECTSNVIDDINSSLALSLAQHAAMPYGNVLDNNEMDLLVNQLFACTNFNYTPNGKSIMTILKQTEIEHLLG